MRLSACLLMLCCACSSGSDSVTFTEPPIQPSPVGSWGGSYSTGQESWPLSGYVEDDESGIAIGELSIPQTPQRQWGFVGEMTREVIAGTVTHDAGTVDLWAELQPEPEETQRERGFLYVGFFSTVLDGQPTSGMIAVRVLP